jgi:hypothetical protein
LDTSRKLNPDKVFGVPYAVHVGFVQTPGPNIGSGPAVQFFRKDLTTKRMYGIEINMDGADIRSRGSVQGKEGRTCKPY